MPHHHDPHPDHSHSHSHSGEGNLPFDKKMIKLLEHWIKHNKDHVGSYMDWAGKAKDENLHEAASLIEEAAGMTDLISEKFEEAARIVKKTGE